jgi:Lanthionine synthetase C-like protein.
MLFDSGRHEPLCSSPWSESRACEVIRAILEDVAEHAIGGCRWPVHPLDREAEEEPKRLSSIYLGAAGVLWALWSLQQECGLQFGSDPREHIQDVYEAYLAFPDTGKVVPSYLLGETGILLALWRLTGSRQAADRLHAVVQANIPNPTNESLWAAPGTMVAAWHLWERTQEDRWRDLFLANVEHVWQRWNWDEQAQCYLWTQDLYGRVRQLLGAGHGFAGNVYPLLKAASLLSEGRCRELHERCFATLRATGCCEGDAVNWPPATSPPGPGGASMLMQWCHGAPGIITACADIAPTGDSELESLLLRAGNAVWDAGPLAKGYGLCHGTAGNGYAFLKLYRRTGDTSWLARARSFAMHSIEQRDRMRRQYGQGRYSLWTGDLGMAMYLAHCQAGTAQLPALDSWD